MSTELVTTNGTAPTAQPREMVTEAEFRTMQNLASAFYASGLFSDTKSEAQAMVKIMAGRELGMGPFESMRDINIIQGKTALAATSIAARMQRAGAIWEPLQFDDKGCVLRFFRSGKQLTPDISFMFEDAKKLGLSGKDNYLKQPRTMFYHRAITMGARMFFPGVFGGPIYSTEELTDSPTMEADAEKESAAQLESEQRANYLAQRTAKLEANPTEYVIEFGNSHRGSKVSESSNSIWLERHLAKYKSQIPEAGQKVIEARIAQLKREYAQKLAAEQPEPGSMLSPEEEAEILANERMEAGE